MSIKVMKIDVWSGEIADQPGGLSSVLGRLAEARANLEMVVARRQPDKPGTGIVFVAPVKGRKAGDAAAAAGLRPAEGLTALRIEGGDKPGLGAQMSQAIADAGINMRGMSAAVIGNRFAAYVAFDSADDADRAGRALKSLAARKPAKKSRVKK